MKNAKKQAYKIIQEQWMSEFNDYWKSLPQEEQHQVVYEKMKATIENMLNSTNLSYQSKKHEKILFAIEYVVRTTFLDKRIRKRQQDIVSRKGHTKYCFVTKNYDYNCICGAKITVDIMKIIYNYIPGLR